MAKIDAFFNLMLEQKASDLHLSSGNPPILRINGELQRVDYPPLESDALKAMLYEIAPEYKIKTFEETGDVDFGYEIPNVSRMRANFFNQKNGISAVFRQIPTKVLSFEDFEKFDSPLPPVLKKFAMLHRGLVLVTGPTGSGKSTTLAAMIDLINETRRGHIVTIEDPIEFVHNDKLSIVSQREVGIDTESFIDAMRSVVRESPDIILIGEMRDMETMHACMQAAETGHLVFSTVHTPSAYETMDRIVNMFPPDEKKHILQRLANTLRGIVAQKLVPRAGGQGRIAAVEIMINTPTVEKMIEDGHIGEIYHAIREGEHWGMRTMNQCLYRYVQKQLITQEDAMNYAGVHSELRQMLRRM